MKYDLAMIANYGANAKLAKDVELIEQVRTSTESLHALADQFKDADLDTESLVDFVNSINDVVLRLLNNFKAVILKGGKRSEMKYFYESHVNTVKRIEGKVVADYEDVMVDFPTGMKGTYPEALEVISAAYTSLDVLMQVDEGNKAADTILSSMSKGSTSHEDVVALADKVLENQLAKQMLAMKNFRKVFTNKGTGKEMRKFSMLFKTMEELKAVRMGLIAQEDKLLGATIINNRLEHMYESVGLAVEFMKNSIVGKEPDVYTPSPKFIKSYMDYIGRLGMAVSNYGEIIIAQMAVEHNLALVYSKLMEA